MSSKNEESIKISKVKAKKESVSFSKPTVIHETSKSKVTFMPFYIQRSSGEELSIKIQTYKKADPPQNWVDVEEKSISLKEPAARLLLKSLKEHLAVTGEEGGDGEYLVIKVSDGTASLENINPEEVTRAILNVLNQKDILEHLKDTELNEELLSAFRGSIRLQELKSAVLELRNYLDSGEVNEKTYQDWCDKHSWAFGNAYIMRDEVRSISATDSVDLILPSSISGFRDIVELKRPDMGILNYDSGHRNYYLTSELSKAIGQVTRYLDVFADEAQNGLRDNPEVVAYHPRATIVIGRSNEWDEDKHRAMHGINRRLSGISIMTYDHLLRMGERLVDFFSSPENFEEDEDIL